MTFIIESTQFIYTETTPEDNFQWTNNDHRLVESLQSPVNFYWYSDSTKSFVLNCKLLKWPRTLFDEITLLADLAKRYLKLKYSLIVMYYVRLQSFEKTPNGQARNSLEPETDGEINKHVLWRLCITFMMKGKSLKLTYGHNDCLLSLRHKLLIR